MKANRVMRDARTVLPLYYSCLTAKPLLEPIFFHYLYSYKNSRFGSGEAPTAEGVLRPVWSGGEMDIKPSFFCTVACCNQ